MSKIDNIRAMVLAAGVGSRLEPLTKETPKPLIPVGGRPVMEHILLLLKTHGITDVISNTHYLGHKIQDYFADAKDRLGINLEFVHEEQLSGVAGGIRKCADFLRKGTACIVMGDALTDIDLTHIYKKHKEAVKDHGCLVTIAMMKVEDTSQFGVIVTKAEGDEKNRVIQFQEKPKASEALSNWANTGIYFFEPEVYDFIPSADQAPVYDVAKDLFPRLLEDGKYMQAIAVQDNTYWADLGNIEQYLQSVKDVSESKVNLDTLPTINPSSSIDGSAQLIGINEIGSSCVIEKGVTLKNCLLWNNVKIQSGASLENCIVSNNTIIDKDKMHNNEVLVASKD